MKKLMMVLLIFSFAQLQSTVAQISKEAQKEIALQKVIKNTEVEKLKKRSIKLRTKYAENKRNVKKWAKNNGELIRKIYSNGKISELQGFYKGKPLVYKTHNRVAAKTVSTNKVQPGGTTGLDLQGEGITVGVWDGGIAYNLHSSFEETTSGPYHVFDYDDSTDYVSDHATHVTGTILADGDDNNSKGMAEKAVVHSYDWNNDISEMIEASIVASNPLLLSNHSYGRISGWDYNSDEGMWYWYGDDIWSKDFSFGEYDSSAQNLDGLVADAPFYTIVWAAGNDRGEGPESDTEHYVNIDSTWTLSTSYREKDGGSDGFDCISGKALAKNVITVGAVDDIENGYQNTTDVKQINTDFSSWGPTDDGRIKPDIVANGDALYSTVYRTGSDSGSYFEIMEGTSMAAPNVTGSIALLQEHYQHTHSQNQPRAATIKGVIIHTADEAGSNPGPDYKFGWGLLNTAKAAEKISEDVNSSNAIQELTLSNNQTYSTDIFNDGTTPLKVTIVWTDPAPSNLMLSKTLVNDLDLRVSNGNNFEPWILNYVQPNQAASTGDNTKDNVEQVYISSPSSGYYTITVTHKGTLSTPQSFSMIISGDVSPEATINISQVDISGSSFGQAAYWNNSSWEYINPTDSVTLDIEDQYFLASHDYKQGTTQKYHYWNVDNGTNNYFKNYSLIPIYSNMQEIEAQFTDVSNATVQNALEGYTSATGGTIMFSDPWLVDATDPQKGSYNQGIGAPLKSVSSPLNLTTGSSYKGVLLNENPQFQQGLPNYSVKVTSPQNIYLSQTGKTHKFYFQNWAATGANLQTTAVTETPVVFTAANALVKANYKGTHLTNKANTYSHGSQKKIIKVPYAYMYVSVYESMNKIWLEGRADGEDTWKILNINNLIDGKNPSLCVVGNFEFALVYQEAYNKINIKVIRITYNNGISINYEGTVGYTDQYYNANPVVASVYNYSNSSDCFLIVWDENYINSFSTPGLNYRLLSRNQSGVYSMKGSGVVPNTNNNTSNPTLTAKFMSTSNESFHLAWQQYVNYNTTSIKYTRINVASNYAVTFSNYSEPSAGRYPLNYNPSIAITLNRPRVAWITQHPVTLIGEAAVRTYGGSNWGGIRSYSYSGGDEVASVSVNNRDANYGYVVAYGGDGREIRYSKGGTTTYQVYPTTTNRDVQVSNGINYTDMYISSLKTTSAPYLFEQNQVDATVNKSGEENNSVGRSANITSNNSLFYCTIKDIIVDGEKINFVEFDEEKEISTRKIAEDYLETEEFTVNKDVDFTFKLTSGSTENDDTKSVIAKDNYVNFIVELLNAKDNSVIDVLTKVNFDKSSSLKMEEKSYEVDAKNIKADKVKIRITVEENIKGNLTIADIISDNRELPKQGYEKIELLKKEVITDYSLAQNYPNPFNPVTTINYKIPNNGIVSLKVYDVLGEEVATLVNEYKTTGSYNVKFDGSNLTSGIYIYTIKAGDFKDTKKLMLMK